MVSKKKLAKICPLTDTYWSFARMFSESTFFPVCIIFVQFASRQRVYITSTMFCLTTPLIEAPFLL